jgi:hypothetical protein
MSKDKSKFPYSLVTETLDHAWDYFYEYLADQLDNKTAMAIMADLNIKDVYSQVLSCAVNNINTVEGEDE